MLNPVIRLTDVKKAYESVIAIKDVSFTVYEKEIFGLLGPNGAGKTTLIRMIVDIVRADSGTVEVFSPRPNGDDKALIGYLPEERGLYTQHRTLPMLEYFGCLKGLDRKSSRQNALGWLERLGMSHVAYKRVKELSKGNQQKIQIIVSLVSDPEILILDEPFSGLDPVNTLEVSELIRELARSGKTILLSTHRMASVEALCQRVLMINKGEAVLYGELDEIIRRYQRNGVYVETDANLSLCDLIAHIVPKPPGRELYLRGGVSAGELLRWLVESGAEVNTFERITPSLEEIFVSVVGDRLPQSGELASGQNSRDAMIQG